MIGGTYRRIKSWEELISKLGTGASGGDGAY